MCTAIAYKNGDTYFGRNLDLDRGYGESVVITPRRYSFPMRYMEPLTTHYAMVGMATVVNNFPLYYDATNEEGLSMAGLSFPGNAVYYDYDGQKDNIAPFELIPWVLGRCACVDDVRQMLRRLNLVKVNFSEDLPLSPLHWMISDRQGSIVLESLADGLKVYENPFEVLTNNPPFDYHRIHMSNYMSFHTGASDRRLGQKIPLDHYSLGMGALGLPGDFSSVSRFVKAFFVKENLATGESERERVCQFFHALNSVAMPRGCVQTSDGLEYTRYSSCCNVDRGVYYYTTYHDLGISSVCLHDVDLEGERPIRYAVTGLA
ncbi:MAG: choloylglycine hydrolase [Clostridia bacterium]|nr:choloylglycine hydrolase [Clostridia bacterium]